MGDTRPVTYEVLVNRIDGAPLRQGTRCVVEISRNGKVKATTPCSDPFQSGRSIQWSQRPAIMVFQSKVHTFSKSATGFRKKEFTIKIRAVDRDGNLVTLGKELLDFGRFTSRDGRPVHREADLSVRLRGTVQMPVMRMDLRSQQGLQQGRRDDWLQDEPSRTGRDYGPVPSLAEESQAFSTWFRQADVDGDGEASGVEAASFFERSGLDRETLFQIWQLADRGEKGALDRRAFDFALRLVSLAQQGVTNLSDPSLLAKARSPASVRLPFFEREHQGSIKHETSSIASDSVTVPLEGSSSHAAVDSSGINELDGLDLFANFYSSEAQPAVDEARPPPELQGISQSIPNATAGDQVLSFVQGYGSGTAIYPVVPSGDIPQSNVQQMPFPNQAPTNAFPVSGETGFEDNFADMIQASPEQQAQKTIDPTHAVTEQQPIMLASSRKANGQGTVGISSAEPEISVEEYEAMKEELQAALEALEAERYEREQLVEELTGKDDEQIAALQAEIEKLRASNFTNEEAVSEARNEKLRRMRAEREFTEMKTAWNQEREELQTEIERLEAELTSLRTSQEPTSSGQEL